MEVCNTHSKTAVRRRDTLFDAGDIPFTAVPDIHLQNERFVRTEITGFLKDIRRSVF
ncbi:hypothetical protein R6Q57_014970 [Mikania cordata]